MRIVGIGTKDKLWRPSARDLALSNWNDSFLDQVDLSKLKIPQMQNADVFSYKATGTTFQNTDYTQFRFPIDLTGAVLPPDTSSYNHDFVVEIMGRATNADHPAVKLVHDHVAASYRHSWNDSIYRAINELGITPDEAEAAWAEAFTGYDRVQSRLQQHMSQKAWSIDPPDTATDLQRVTFRAISDEPEVDLRSHFSFASKDRWAMSRVLKDYLSSRYDVTRLSVWITQLVPNPTLFLVGQEVIESEHEDWLRRHWPR